MPTISADLEPTVSVTVGDISPDDSNAKYKDQQNALSIWNDYFVANRYERDKHVYMMGMTSPDGFSSNQGSSSQQDTVSFVQLASPTLLWISDWTASRYNEKPKIPDPTLKDPNWILLDDHYEPAMQTIAPDGVTPLWRISGTYIYGHKRPTSKVIDLIYYPRPPWLDDFTSRTIDANDLEKNIMDQQNQTTGGLTGFPTLVTTTP